MKKLYLELFQFKWPTTKVYYRLPCKTKLGTIDLLAGPSIVEDIAFNVKEKYSDYFINRVQRNY